MRGSPQTPPRSRGILSSKYAPPNAERAREPDVATTTESTEIPRLEREIAELEARRAEIENRIADAKIRLAEARRKHKPAERGRYAELATAARVPEDWSPAYRRIDIDGPQLPKNFGEVVRELRFMKHGPDLQDRETYRNFVADYRQIANGTLEGFSRGNPSLKLREVREGYPEWSQTHFRTALMAVAETGRTVEVQTFDQLAEALEARMRTASEDCGVHIFYSNLYTQRMNEILRDFLRKSPSEWRSRAPEQAWFTDDRERAMISFGGLRVARYQKADSEGNGGGITDIHPGNLRQALDTFLRDALPRMPRTASWPQRPASGAFSIRRKRETFFPS